MKRRAFQKLLSQIEKLTTNQEKQLQIQLNKLTSLKTITNITIEVDHCPHCGATNSAIFALMVEIHNLSLYN